MWRLEKKLAAGGMGEVFLAQDPEGKQVAVKLTPLQQEVSLLVKLRHPSIVAILGFEANSKALFGEDRGPCYWMEYIEGEPILLAANKADKKQVLTWLTQALEALQYLHSQGILHGDLSPENILIDKNERLKIVDFGVSGFLESETVVNAATLPYMAPEKIDGQAAPSSDLYSLGTIFYQALSGQHPRAGCRSLEEIMRKAPKPLGDTLEERVVDRMIRTEPSERFAKASEALEAIHSGSTTSTTVTTDYHSARMFGADTHFSRVADLLRHSKKEPRLICVHGATGVGKSRFIREILFQAALEGVPSKTSLDLETKSLAELAPLLSRPTDGLTVLEWNDDGVKPQCVKFFQKLLTQPHAEDIHLKNLSRKHAQEFLQGALGDSAAEAIDPLFEQTDGNPLLLRELTRCLLEKRAATGEVFSQRWIKDLKKLSSFEDVLELRLAGLGQEQLSILQKIATAHEPVSFARLIDMIPSGDLPEVLVNLADKELVRQDRDARYRLSLPSLEQAVLKSLPEMAVLAMHREWMKLLRVAPADDLQKIHHAVALKDEAALLAGARSGVERLSADGQKEKALSLVSQALSALSDRDETSRLFRAKINILNELGRFEAALEVCDAWFELKDAQDEPQALRELKYWFITGLNHQNLGNHGEAAARLLKCLQVGNEQDPAQRPLIARSHSLLGVHEMKQGHLGKAKDHLQQGLNLVGPAGRRRAELCRNLAEVHSLEGDGKGAKRLLEEAVALYRADHYDEGEFYVRLQEGNLARAREDYKNATQAYGMAQEIAEQRRDELQRALVEGNRGIVARQQGDLAESLKLLSRAREVFEISGNRRDLAQNLMQLSMTEASVGHFQKAADLIQELKTMAGEIPAASEFAQDAEAALRKFREDRGSDQEAAKLKKIYAELPPELQMTFAERQDFKTWCSPQAGAQPTKKPSETMEGIVSLLDDLAELNRELLEETDMNRLLKRLMDRALELAKAENGFLVLKDEGATAPLPGFSVAVEKNISRKALEKEEYRPSLSAVKRAMQTGLPVVTDNAVDDPLFRDSKSIHLHKLRSLIALPVVGTEGVIGVFYLDHRLTRGLFEGETLAALKAFAGVAALALQKSRMIEDLKSANRDLSDEVEIKTSEIGLMQRELKKSRQVLKNEYAEIVGRSPRMVEVLSLVDRITDAKIPVWIFGESGTGKESIARALHFNSPRTAKPFVSENCSALPESLLESELFGHKKGAFTHAVADKKGILQYADGGTVFLDEIADMSLGMQAKLLRFLQEGEIRPVGSSQMIKVDVRVVSASNRHLADLVRQGKFREDLYFRLNGVTVTLPALRDRKEDLPLLVDHFLDKISQREKKLKLKISQDAMRLLMGHDWPGNIRELQNTLETAALFTEKGVIVPESFQFKPVLLGKYTVPSAEAAREASPKAIPEELAKILRVIRDEGYHRSNAAKALGMSRRNFYTKLEKFGVPRDFKSLKEYVEKYVG